MSGAKDKRALMKVRGQQLRHKFEVSYTERPGHATEIARSSDADIVVAVGGDGTVKKQPKKVVKIGRNDPCPCGSGKKYKNCHGRGLA